MLEAHDGSNGRPAEDAPLRARLMLASGSAAEALEEIDSTKPLAAELDFSRRIEANVLEAVAKRELNDRGGAAGAIEEASRSPSRTASAGRSWTAGRLSSRVVEQIRRHRPPFARGRPDRRVRTPRRRRLDHQGEPQPPSERERAILRYPDDDVERRDRVRVVRLGEHGQDAPEEASIASSAPHAAASAARARARPSCSEELTGSCS